MITASSSLQTSAVSGNKLASRNSPLSFSMSLSPGAGSSASPASSVSRADSVATGASPVGRSATPSPDRRSPGAGGSHNNLHESPISFSGNRRPHSSASSPVRSSASPTREGRGDRDHAGLSGVAGGIGSGLHVPMTSSMSFAALHAAAAAAAANQGALMHGKAGLLASMGPGVPVSLAGLAGIPEHAYHPGLYLGHPAAAAAAAAAAANLQNAERSLFGQGLHGHPGLHGGSGHGNSHNHSNHHNDRSPYNSHSPPPIPTTDPTANECKLVDYRGQKVAAFIIHGETMLCLPQAFELFLKHLVGGLHTVYTKLKRLDIVPLVCNVEQVRILRGLGAIQPGVNRCKLLSCKDFDILYKDCTTARPGRPPKRSPLMGITSPQHDVLMKMKKPRLDNGDYLPYENGHGGADSRMEKSPLLANGYNPPPTHLNPMQFMALNHAAQQAAAAAAAQHALLGSPASAGALAQSGGLPGGLAALGGSANHPALSGQNQGSSLPNYGNHNGGGAGHHGGLALSRAESDAIKGGHGSVPVDPITAARSGFWENCRAAYEDVVKHLERLKDDRSESEKTTSTLDAKTRDLTVHNGSSASPILNLSKSGDGSAANGPHADDKQREPSAGTTSAAQDEHDDDDEDGDVETEETAERTHRDENGASASDDRHGHFLPRLPKQLHHSQAAAAAAAEEDHSDVNEDEEEDDEDKHEMSDGMGRDESSSPRPHGDKGLQAARASTATSAQAVAAAAALNYSAFLNASVASHGDPSVMLNSTENLLRNIQGLLKVAAENARQQDRQANYEKAELKMEILREREMREGLEKQMMEEQRARVLYQKRLKKERRARRKLADQLEMEAKRRGQYEEALKSTSAETLRMINEKLNQEMEMERNARNSSSQSQSSQPTPAANEMMNTSHSENRGVYYKNSVLFTNAS